ncbi:thiopurine S-methyltransferase [Leptospira ryugenii]|uniref:Thiopurine S-methyltransferase n=1 Tax=Leptospira ryugenii TaxID=1917863 RepID=A0A2P2E1J1_9LEPT|nr:thiopurine S-methyltransferase [Leptospira ryugenii]GBF50757.1 thiopurine S-methyltransferase [Leptospira ryugenii]
MEAEFWYKRWENLEIGFHEEFPNPFLVEYFSKLQLQAKGTIFVPLCGKTKDISWLLERDLQVVAVELSPLAITQLFTDLKYSPERTQVGNLTLWEAPNLKVFEGDIFQLEKEQIGSFDAIYDRAALVALPYGMRVQYVHKLRSLTDTAKILLICFEYDQSLASGPPFSISEEEIRSHYGQNFELNLFTEMTLTGGLRGKIPAKEKVWYLEPKPQASPKI